MCSYTDITLLQIVSQVFADHKQASSTRHLNRVTGRVTTLKPRTPTVAAGFHQSLSTLLDKITRLARLSMGVFSFAAQVSVMLEVVLHFVRLLSSKWIRV